MFDLAAIAPDPWPHPKTYAPNSDLRLDGGDFLSEDFCILGRNYLVRCQLPVPVQDADAVFAFGCWGSLSRENFESYLERFDDGRYEDCGPWTSWLCNDLLGLVGTSPIGCLMFPQPNRQRPVLEVHDAEHPLARMQALGISAEQVVEIYKLAGHAIA